ncbi:MAG: BMP family ABC transporter substrate-binding protein, partial [Anaerolineae bacterium]
MKKLKFNWLVGAMLLLALALAACGGSAPVDNGGGDEPAAVEEPAEEEAMEEEAMEEEAMEEEAVEEEAVEEEAVEEEAMEEEAMEEEAMEEGGVQVCQVTDVGGIDDKSFNATAWAGAERAAADMGIEVKFLESQQQTDYDKNINAFIDDG